MPQITCTKDRHTNVYFNRILTLASKELLQVQYLKNITISKFIFTVIGQQLNQANSMIYKLFIMICQNPKSNTVPIRKVYLHNAFFRLNGLFHEGITFQDFQNYCRILIERGRQHFKSQEDFKDMLDKRCLICACSK